MSNTSPEYAKLHRNIRDKTPEEDMYLMKNIIHILELRSYSSWLLLNPESNKEGLKEQIDFCNEELKLLLNL